MKRLVYGLLVSIFLSVALIAQTGQIGNYTRIRLNNGPIILSGSGTPEGAVIASPGSVYLRTDNGTVWRKASGTGNTGWSEITGGGGGGTVTSVGLSLPGQFNVSGSPVTTSGTLTGTWANAAANRIFAGPSTGADSTPNFRLLVAADIPSVTSAMITDGTITFADWASNSCANGEIPKWNGSAWACSTDAGASSGAPAAAQYVTLATDATLTNERVLTGSSRVSVTDAGAGSTVTLDVPDAGITYAKIQDVTAASKLLGRGDSGSGDVQEITLGTGLSMSGTTLSASGGSSNTTILLKTANETVNNSSTLQSDDHLTMSLAANSVYRWSCYLIITAANTTADWKWGLTLPASATARWGPHLVGNFFLWDPPITTNSPSALITESGTTSTGSTNNTSGMNIIAIIETAGTSGTAAIQWAQDVANASNSVVEKNSNCIVTKLN